MCIPLWILAVGAAFLGLILDHHTTGMFNGFLELTIPAGHAVEHHGVNWFVVGVSTAAAVVGIGVAWGLYASGTSPLPARLNALAGPLADLSRNKFYLDEVYAVLFVWPLKAVAQLSRFLDWGLVDGLFVGGIGKLPALVGRLPRPIQNGLVQFYALAMTLALGVLLWVLLTKQSYAGVGMHGFSQMALFLMVAFPAVGAVLVLLFARYGIAQVRRFVLTNVLITFALSIVVVADYNPNLVDKDGRAQLIQMRMSLPWVGSVDGQGQHVGPDIQFALGVDGLSLWLVFLSAVLMISAVLVSWEAVQDRPASFYALMLLLESGLIGVFAAQDIILFYIFFEFTLIPLFFMVGIWGGHDRRFAARGFFIYTLAGSLLTFLALIFIVLSYSWMSPGQEVTFSIPALTDGISALVQQDRMAEKYWTGVSPWIFMALFAGFAIKVPLFPFHTWLPLAHVEAPTAGSVLLAGVLLKIGSYGFLRFALPLVPIGCWWAFDVIAILAVIGIIYGTLLALAQDDIKKLVAYSSVSHMGFCLLGLFALNAVGITGGLLQMVNHGLSTGALFAMVGMLYERYHTRDIDAYGGMARKFPILAFCLGVVTFSSIGLPGLNGFTGEITALLGMFQNNQLYACLGLTGIILGAWYMLWLVQRTFFGRLREPVLEEHGDHAHPGDLDTREILALAPILILIVWIGIYPQFFTSRMEPSINKVVAGLTATRAGYASASTTPGKPGKEIPEDSHETVVAQNTDLRNNRAAGSPDAVTLKD